MRFSRRLIQVSAAVLSCGLVVVFGLAGTAAADEVPWSAATQVAGSEGVPGSRDVTTVPQVAVGPNGAAAIVWEDAVPGAAPGDQSVYRVWVARVSPQGAVSPAQDVAATPGDGPDPHPAVAVAPDGGAVVVFNRGTADDLGDVALIRIAPDGTVSPEQSVPQLDRLGGDVPTGSVVVAPDDTVSLIGAHFGADPNSAEGRAVVLAQVPVTGPIASVVLDDALLFDGVVRVMANGDTVAAWWRFDGQDLAAADVRVRHISPAGLAAGLLPTNGTLLGGSPAIAGDGSVLVGRNNQAFGFLQRMSAPGIAGTPTMITGWTSTGPFVNLNASGAGCGLAEAGQAGGIAVLAMSANGVYATPSAYLDTGNATPYSILTRPDGICSALHMPSGEDPNSNSIAVTNVLPDETVSDTTILMPPAAGYDITAGASAIAGNDSGAAFAVWKRGGTGDHLSATSSVWVARKGATLATGTNPPPSSNPGGGQTPAPPGGAAANPLCSGLANVLCLPGNQYPTSSAPGSPRQACDPGADNGWLNIAGTTFACIFTGDIWDDPTLISAKQKCVTNMGLAITPMGQTIKFLLKAGKRSKRAVKLQKDINSVIARLNKASYPGKSTSDAKAIRDGSTALNLVSDPNAFTLTLISNKRIFTALASKLSNGDAAAIALASQIATLANSYGTIVADITGLQDVADCVTAFSGK